MYAKKNSGKKLVAVLVVLTLLLGCVVGGTLAWLATKTDPLENTFTAGKIALTLTEPNFQTNTSDGRRKFLPGETFSKDPTVTVLQGSEPCYVRAFVVIWWDAKADPNFDAEDGKDWFIGNTDETNKDGVSYESYRWELANELYDNTSDKVLGIVMEYRWTEAVDAQDSDKVLWPLFGAIKVPGDLSTAQYDSLENFRLVVLAQAVQANHIPDVDNDGNVDADDAFDLAGIPDVTLEYWNNQSLAKVIEDLSAQSVTNDRLPEHNDPDNSATP